MTKKNILVTILTLAVLAAVAALYIGQNADPKNPLYTVDRFIEEQIGKTKTDNNAKLQYQLDLAEERLLEIKTMGTETGFDDEFTVLVQDYASNLENIKNIYEEMAVDGTDEELGTIAENLINTRLPSFERSLEARKSELEDADNDETRAIVRKGSGPTRALEKDIFEIAISNIEENHEFDKIAEEILLKKVRSMSLDMDAYTEDTFTAIQYAKKRDGLVLQDILNDAREKFIFTRNGFYGQTYKETYDGLKEAEEKFGLLSHALVDLSQNRYEEFTDPDLKERAETRPTEE